MKISCNQCGRFLFDSESESIGGAGAEAAKRGFVYKMPFLFTDKYIGLFFCNHECGKEFYKNNIPKNEEATIAIENFKKDISARSAEVTAKMYELLKKIKNGK